MNRLSEIPSIAGLGPERVRVAVMRQSWCQITFLHWRFPVEVVQALVPRSLAVESFDGAAWVGITPFIVSGLRPPLLPALPWISRFPETNCRTYVTGPDGHRGVWFFSLDAARAAAVAGARLAYGLPYAWSRMRVLQSPRRMRYDSTRIAPQPGARAHFLVEPGSPIDAPSALDVFLTARFRLYSLLAGRLSFTSVEHGPWALRRARLLEADQAILCAAGLPQPAELPTVHFSEGVHVRVAAPRLVFRSDPVPASRSG